jgi:hypothetical protein
MRKVQRRWSHRATHSDLPLRGRTDRGQLRVCRWVVADGVSRILAGEPFGFALGVARPHFGVALLDGESVGFACGGGTYSDPSSWPEEPEGSLSRLCRSFQSACF